MNFWDPIRAVLFDLDGTLIESRIDFAQLGRTAWMLVRQSRIPLDHQIRDLIAMTHAACAYLERREGREQAERFRAALYTHWEIWERMYAAQASMTEGANALWRWLESRGVQIGVVTRNSRRLSLELLQRYNWVPNCLVTRDDFLYLKPDPRHLLHALELLGITPQQALMIGDHPTDIQAGKAAGISTVGLLTPKAHPTHFAEAMPDRIVHSLSELLHLL